MAQCFRCNYTGKILVNMNIDGVNVPFCPSCVRDYGLFLEGHVVDPMVIIDRSKHERLTE